MWNSVTDLKQTNHTTFGPSSATRCSFWVTDAEEEVEMSQNLTGTELVLMLMAVWGGVFRLDV